jgi:hypothetical protein
MSCPNIKVKFVKMSDTKFYCCDKFPEYTTDGYGTPIEYTWKKDGLKYCPFCGTKLSINYV